ncbi:MAG: hypothetical protein LRY51_00580 [Geovibrio sp.]|nr:hypothetical protein [Geovibrio sp.]
MRNIFKLILLALAFAAITACGGSSGSKDEGGLSMNLRFEQPEERSAMALESLYLIVANEDLNITKDSYDLLQLYNEGSGSFTVSGLTDGDKYYFKVYGYAEDSMVYYGAASLVVQPGSIIWIFMSGSQKGSMRPVCRHSAWVQCITALQILQ